MKDKHCKYAFLEYVVPVLAFIVSVLVLKAQIVENRPYIFVEPINNDNVSGGFTLLIGNSGSHPSSDIRLKYMLLADCDDPSIEMAFDNVVVVNDIVKGHDEKPSFSPSIADSKKECLSKINLLVLKFHYEDPQVWRFCPLNLLIPKEFNQTFFFKISPGTPWPYKGFWKLGSPKIERPIAMEDVRIAYEKYANHFEKKKTWLNNWWEGFPVKPDL